jgi:hypothetical protein
MISYESTLLIFKSESVRLTLSLNPDCPQGSNHGSGILKHLAENPTANSQYPGFPLAKSALQHLFIENGLSPKSFNLLINIRLLSIILNSITFPSGILSSIQH